MAGVSLAKIKACGKIPISKGQLGLVQSSVGLKLLKLQHETTFALLEHHYPLQSGFVSELLWQVHYLKIVFPLPSHCSFQLCHHNFLFQCNIWDWSKFEDHHHQWHYYWFACLDHWPFSPTWPLRLKLKQFKFGRGWAQNCAVPKGHHFHPFHLALEWSWPDWSFQE